MKLKWISLICILALGLCLAGCGEGKETTLTGIVVSVDGTVVTLQEFNIEKQELPSGRMPAMPEGEERPAMPEGFDPENFNGEKPNGFDPGERLPEGETMPQRPENGEIPNFAGQGETTEVDLANAHISVEIDGGKATGSMQDITQGVMLTITLDKNGKAVNVLVSSIIPGGKGNRDIV